MTYHEFLAYLFDRPQARDLALELSEVVGRRFTPRQPQQS